MTAVPQPARAGSELVARPAGVARSGRDRRHQSPRRSRNITAAFTDAEYAALTAAARRLGLTPTGFCAQAALAAAVAPANDAVPCLGADPRVEALAEAQVELATLRTAVVRVGTNLNQAVAALHATGEAPVWLRHCGRAVRLRPGRDRRNGVAGASATALIPNITRGQRVHGLLIYLWGPGRREEHTDPHLVAAWDGAGELADLEPAPQRQPARRPASGRTAPHSGTGWTEPTAQTGVALLRPYAPERFDPD